MSEEIKDGASPEKIDRSRRKALGLLGLAGLVGYAAPTLLTINEAEARTHRRRDWTDRRHWRRRRRRRHWRRHHHHHHDWTDRRWRRRRSGIYLRID